MAEIDDSAAPNLKAPFPAFGGKSRVAAEVWVRLDGVRGTPSFDPARNYLEPFFFSGGAFWKRGHVGAVETVNDLNAFVANFWRAVQHDPDAVAFHADWPVSETDLHARHKWLVGSDQAVAALARVREDPEAFDAKIAGWWCWGACCWIGSGWCDETHRNSDSESRPSLSRDGRGNGINRAPTEKLPQMDVAGRLINSPPQQLPHLHGDSGAHGRGVNASGMTGVRGIDLRDPPQRINLDHDRGITCGSSDHAKRPKIATEGDNGVGVNGKIGRIQLADEFARGRGVNGNDRAGTCEARAEWIKGWMRALSDRLRPVRVCCGQWDRICDSPSTMTRLGTTAVTLDPPYRKKLACGKTNRTSHIYANDKVQDVDAICDGVQAWCLKWAPDKQVRIALCGLEGEYPEIEKTIGTPGGWTVLAWKSNGGYGNQSGKKNENAARERVWFSPHCIRPEEEKSLFCGGNA